MAFFTNHSMVLWLVVLIASLSLFGFRCIVTGLSRRPVHGAIRPFVERLPICGAAEINQRLPSTGGYDTAFSKPVSSVEFLRVEGYVQTPTTAHILTAPLTRQPCVLYSSSVNRHLHDGIPPVPVAFACASVNFTVTLADAPQVQIAVKGADVSLFDMYEGRRVEQKSFDHMPDTWQDFISSHRTSPHLSSTMRSDGSRLEFTECALRPGTLVTIAGELHRDADGSISMRPWSGGGEASRRAPREGWRTSWEAGSCLHPEVNSPREKDSDLQQDKDDDVRTDKVYISDAPDLLHGRTPVLWQALACIQHCLDRCKYRGKQFASRRSDDIKRYYVDIARKRGLHVEP